MAVRTVYKGKSEYRDPNTGSIYVDRPGKTAEQQRQQFTDNIILADQPYNTLAQVGVAPGGQNIQQSAQQSSSKKTTYTPVSSAPGSGFNRRSFTPSRDTNEYYDLMRDTEGDKPGAFQSRYEGAIQSILDGILNRKSFDLKSDANYNMLYDQAREKYMTAGNKAMRDTMGAMQAATGGYGSTAAQIAGSQAYDNYMQGLNDNNVALAQLAYQMYGDETADRYNQLGAVTGLDNTDYSRYRDDVNDWYNDRNYYANQYQNFFNNDRRGYEYDTGLDWDEYQYENNLAYQRERDELSDYDNAFNKAYQLAQAGQPIPARYASLLEPETLAQLNGLAAQMLVQQAAGGSGGGSGGRRRSGSSKKKSEDTGERTLQISPTAINAMDRRLYEKSNSDEAYKRALFYSVKGYNDNQLTDMLLQYGYSDKDIASALNKLRG